MQQLKIWWQAIRFHFTFPTFLPVLLGTQYAILETGKWNGLSLFAVLLATVCHHIGLNLADDYYDYCHGADVFNHTGHNLYAGGSGVLTAKMLTPKNIKLAAIFCYSVTIIIGLILTYVHGYWILGLGIFGIFSSFYYTAPPLKFAYRGLGELLIWLNFGPILLLGSYYLQTHTISIGAVLLSIVIGTATFCLITANEIPDHDTDQASGKKTLVVRFGKKFGLWLLILGIITIFVVLLVAIITNIWPVILMIGCLSIPLAYCGINTLAKTIHSNKIYGNEFIVGFCNLLGALLICTFGFLLFQANYLLPASTILATLAALYLPILIFSPK